MVVASLNECCLLMFQLSRSDTDIIRTILGAQTIESYGNRISNRVQCKYLPQNDHTCGQTRKYWAEMWFDCVSQVMRQNVQEFATSLLDHTRTSHELEVMLNYNPLTGCEIWEPGERQTLERLKLAIKYKQKMVRRCIHWGLDLTRLLNSRNEDINFDLPVWLSSTRRYAFNWQ